VVNFQEQAEASSPVDMDPSQRINQARRRADGVWLFSKGFYIRVSYLYDRGRVTAYAASRAGYETLNTNQSNLFKIFCIYPLCPKKPKINFLLREAVPKLQFLEQLPWI
jgi:hypothetical protein